MQVRAAAALQKALTFQNVREGVTDATPSAVAPLVELLKRKGSTERGAESARKHEEGTGVTRHEQPRKRGLGQAADSQKEPFKLSNKVT